MTFPQESYSGTMNTGGAPSFLDSEHSERGEPSESELLLHEFDRKSIDKWQLSAIRPTFQPSRKEEITSLDQFCPTTSIARFPTLCLSFYKEEAFSLPAHSTPLLLHKAFFFGSHTVPFLSQPVHGAPVSELFKHLLCCQGATAAPVPPESVQFPLLRLSAVDLVPSVLAQARTPCRNARSISATNRGGYFSQALVLPFNN